MTVLELQLDKLNMEQIASALISALDMAEQYSNIKQQ